MPKIEKGKKPTKMHVQDLPFAKHPVNLTVCRAVGLMMVALMTMRNHCLIPTNPLQKKHFGMQSKNFQNHFLHFMNNFLRYNQCKMSHFLFFLCVSQSFCTKSSRVIRSSSNATALFVVQVQEFVRGLPLICRIATRSERSWFVLGFHAAVMEK